MKKKHPFCSTCKNHHPQYDDGFEWLDCMLFMKKRDGKKKSGWLVLLFNHNYSYPVLPHNLQYKMDMGDRVGFGKQQNYYSN